MPASRPSWKGHLKLSLVSCPVALYPATKAERVSFRQTNRSTGNRLRQQLVDEVTGEVVERTSAVRGFDVAQSSELAVDDAPQRPTFEPKFVPEKRSKSEDAEEDDFSTVPEPRGYDVPSNRFIPVEDDELAALRAEHSHMIEIDRFVSRSQVDTRYFDSHYYVVPNDPVGQEAFAVIREAMRDKEMVAIGRVVISRRERPIILDPSAKGLRGITLRSSKGVRDEADYFDEIPDVEVPADMLDLARHILETKRADFDPYQFDDRFEAKLLELLKRKQLAMPTQQALPAQRSANVVNLMDALKKSIASEKPKGRKVASPPTQPVQPRAGAKKRVRAR